MLPSDPNATPSETTPDSRTEANGSPDNGHPTESYPIPLRFKPHFCPAGVDPYELIRWRTLDVEILGSGFYREGIEIPEPWSDNAARIVASKYFYGDPARGDDPASGGAETSVKQLIRRVCEMIAVWGFGDGYFASRRDAEIFRSELTALCLGQFAAFNSPVWFNVGLSQAYKLNGGMANWRWSENQRAAIECEDCYKFPQASACFIQSVSDDMASIMDLATSEAMLFKHGSGTGTDLSTLRSSKEKLAGGGKPSGPISFMRIYDAIASVVKSGGKTRRAAKMQTLKCTHPNVVEFVTAKSREDRKARALIAAGYSSDMDGDAYGSVMFQNSNLSLRVTDRFMKDADGGFFYHTKAVTTGERVEQINASELLDLVSSGTWECGDPGLQYEDTIQRWHTCPNTAPINSSNPCSEYMFIDDSACNLASINLMKFRCDDGSFDVDGFRAAVRIMIVAQEILVDHASYPTKRIAENSHSFRPLGLGYANLGALLMANGLAYDSDDGRQLAAGITSIMHGQAYRTSAELAGAMEAFSGYMRNRDSMLSVLHQHLKHSELLVRNAEHESEAEALATIGMSLIADSISLGVAYGFRNSQVTLLAPTGTIAFMMDCDTTGIEPETSLVKTKQLAGGGSIRIVNQSVNRALQTLGYQPPHRARILAYLEEHGTIDDCPSLEFEDRPIFDCAIPSSYGGPSISWLGHIRMMEAVQPFLSGAISKTVNMPSDSTPADIRAAYIEGWKRGLKSLAIYRDSSKATQPLSARPISPLARELAAEVASELPASAIIDSEFGDRIDTIRSGSWRDAQTIAGDLTMLADQMRSHAEPDGDAEPPSQIQPRRHRLPITRRSITHKFVVDGHEGYCTVGLYPEGHPGELFIKMAKEGSTIGGLMDLLGIAVSVGLQYGVPLQVFVEKFAYTRFEPAGFTPNPDIPQARSLADYIFRWLGMEFLKGYRDDHAPHREESPSAPSPNGSAADDPLRQAASDRLTYATAMLQKTAAQMQDLFGPESISYLESHTPPCRACGASTVRAGACYACPNCGESSGCG